MDNSKKSGRPSFLNVLLLLLGFWVAAYFFLPSLANNNKRPTIPRARMEIANLNAALSQYHSELGEYPSGTKAGVLKRLLGDNSKKITFFLVNPKSVNSAGEFMDPWKTPYEIKISSQTNFTIYSAGPNRIFGDKDDLMLNSVSNAIVKP